MTRVCKYATLANQKPLFRFGMSEDRAQKKKFIRNTEKKRKRYGHYLIIILIPPSGSISTSSDLHLHLRFSPTQFFIQLSHFYLVWFGCLGFCPPLVFARVLSGGGGSVIKETGIAFLLLYEIAVGGSLY
jgi:hypothetical protein